MKSILILSTFLILALSMGCSKVEQDKSNELSMVVLNLSNFDTSNSQHITKWDQFIFSEQNLLIQQFTFNAYSENGDFLYTSGKTYSDTEQHNLTKVIAEMNDQQDILFQTNINTISLIEQKENKTNIDLEIALNLKKENLNYSKSRSRRLNQLFILLENNSLESLNYISKETNVTIDNIKSLKFDRSQSIEKLNTRDAINWTPDFGTLETYQYNSKERALKHTFKWKVKPFIIWQTYEHDFFLNNYSDSKLIGTYFTQAQNSSGFPICSWASNMPNSYLDTRLFDESGFQGNKNEISYTIGCGDANKLSKDVLYSTAMILAKGNANYDNGKLNAQQGYQSPANCTSPWCSFAYSNDRIIKAWDIYVPSGFSWQH